MVPFNTIHDYTFIISFINPTHCCTLTTPNYLAMLVYKPKQHLKQQTGLNYLTNFEMTHLKFSLTNQCHKTTILRIVFKYEKS